MSNAKLGAGNVDVTLAGEVFTLRPSLKAAQIISRRDGGILGSIDKASIFDLDTIVLCIALATDTKPADIEEKVWEAGLSTLAPPVMRFLTMLANGGRPANEGGSEGKKGEAKKGQ